MQVQALQAHNKRQYRPRLSDGTIFEDLNDVTSTRKTQVQVLDCPQRLRGKDLRKAVKGLTHAVLQQQNGDRACNVAASERS